MDEKRALSEARKRFGPNAFVARYEYFVVSKVGTYASSESFSHDSRSTFIGTSFEDALQQADAKKKPEVTK